MIDLKNTDALTLLSTIADNTVDLVLTDPPYVISKESGMQACRDNNIPNQNLAVQTDFGDWDKNFSMDEFQQIIIQLFRVLKKGGTIIVFFDIWKLSLLKELLEIAGFKQLRFIEWIKTNPVPINSKINYLTNAREIALTAVKSGKGTFNSEYDNGIYEFAIHQGKKGDRIHPTQKSLLLFQELIKKHSNQGETVLDCFSGSGTTAIAAKTLDRNFIGSELNEQFFKSSLLRIEKFQKIEFTNSIMVF